MRRAEGRHLAAPVLLATLLAGCTGSGPVVPGPEGFAAYASEGLHRRAVSPEGVVYRVRTEVHEPRAELAFWAEAVRRRMEEAGYGLLGEEELQTTAGSDAHLLELTAPVGDLDYEYLIAILPADDVLVIVEVAGEITALQRRRDAILAAIEGIEVGA